MPNVKFIPKNIEQVREVLIDFPADLEIELEIGRPARRKDHRRPPFAIDLAARLGPDVLERDPESTVKVSKASVATGTSPKP